MYGLVRRLAMLCDPDGGGGDEDEGSDIRRRASAACPLVLAGGGDREVLSERAVTFAREQLHELLRVQQKASTIGCPNPRRRRFHARSLNQQ